MNNEPTAEEEIAALIAALPPAPEAWVRRAERLADASQTSSALPEPEPASLQEHPLTRAEVDATIALMESALAMLVEPEVEAHGQGLLGRVSQARSQLESALELLRRRRGSDPGDGSV
jgi:hypothetical protein